MNITYYGQDSSYFSHLKKVIDILKEFDFPVTDVTCVFDGMYNIGTEQYVIEGDDNLFTLTVDSNGQYYIEYNGKTELVGDPGDEIKEIAHYIDIILNGPEEDIRDLFESLIREDKRTDFFQEYLQLPIEWESRDSEDVKKSFFDALWAADTSSNKKYLPWFFKRIKQEPRKVSPIGLDTNVRQISEYMGYIESRVNNYSIDDWNNRLKNGDLIYYEAIWDKIGKSPKDINSYPDLNAIRAFYNHIKQFNISKDEIKKAKKESKKIYEDANYLIVQPLTYEASCVYGRETKWCVASKDSSRYFDDYMVNSFFYYVINKKGKSNKYSKFALRLPIQGSKIEVWDQQDARSTFDIMYDKMPGIDKILEQILNLNMGEYATLISVRDGKINPEAAFNDVENLSVSVEDNKLMLNIYFENVETYFKELFRYSLYSHSIQEILHLLSPYSSSEYFDSYTADEDLKEGYPFYSLSDDGKKYLDDIVKLLDSNLYSQKESLDERDYFEKVGKLVSNYSELFEKLSEEYFMSKNGALTVGLEGAIYEEYCDPMSVFGVDVATINGSRRCFKKYKTTVDKMIELYEKQDKKSVSIYNILALSLDSETSVPDIFESTWEYEDRDIFEDGWQSESRKVLEDFYEKITDEDDGYFDDLDEYKELIDYVINGFGFNISREIKTQPGSYFKVLEITPDNKIKVEINKGYERRHYLLSAEQLETLVRNYKLF